ncbi:MAG TPA: ATP-binding protein, partial [Ignavibacteriaceae bacterium]
NNITFNFSSLDFNSSEHIHFLYRLEGFDKDWIYSTKRRFAAYNNLNPGTYYFRLKATNSDGIWGKTVKSIKVTINPPWWKTGWAYSVYILVIFLGLVGIRRFELNLIKLRHEIKIRDFESKKHRDIENVKSRFFANLSHEFRTPLMLIKGPLEQLKNGRVKGDPQNYYDIIYRNTENLHTLIDQLLELTQLEAEAIPVKAREVNLITLLRGIFFSFESIANEKNISIEFVSDDKSICAWVDRDKLEKIINNILSNAFKFTAEGGIISLAVKKIITGNEEFARIKISDTGIGIPEDKLHKIFDRFYQVDDSSGRVYGGSGIGLALVKELIDLHKWEINIESEIEKGTTFILTIPLSEYYLSDNQKIKDEIRSEDILEAVTDKSYNQDVITESNNAVKDQNISDDKLTTNNPSILVVEDSSDVQEYIYSLFQNDYKIIQAMNAEEGIIKASEQMPDLILSDVMMPGMGGLEFCKQIKTNFQTSHIPIILLTAKVSSENKIEGLETGADDYVTKPFNFKELSVRIKNLLEQRNRLKEKFGKELKINPENVTVNFVDKEFLERALKIAENNIYSSDFDSELFAKEMFVSRSQLHRKMIAITGQAPGEFIRIYRLKKAAQLLLEKKLSVTQISLEVGFNSPSHFTKAFQQYFNCLPSEFVGPK